MTELNNTWLCALLVASGKVSARDVTPKNLENFNAFINKLQRRKLLAIEDAFEFAWDAMARIEGEQAIKLVMEIGVMRELVRDLIYETEEINSAVEVLMK